jgi:hypothetical protein
MSMHIIERDPVEILARQIAPQAFSHGDWPIHVEAEVEQEAARAQARLDLMAGEMTEDAQGPAFRS